jgi:hypothetical protein
MSAEDFVSALKSLMSKDNEEEEAEEEEKESAAHDDEEDEEKNNSVDNLVQRKVDLIVACQKLNVKHDARAPVRELELMLVSDQKKHMETANKSEEYIRALADDVIASIDTVVAVAPKKKSVLNRVDVVAHEEEEDRIEAAKRIARMR